MSKLYYFSTTLYCCCLLISNIMAVKLIEIFGITLPAAVILFPVVYILNDVFSEVYGFEKAKKAIYTGFAMNLIMVVFFTISINLPYPEYWGLQQAYASILGNTFRALIGSLTAYIVGNLINSKIMVIMKEKLNKYLFARCVISTLFGELSDSLIFIPIAFIGTMPLESMVVMILTQASAKTIYEMIVYPVTKKVIYEFKNFEQHSN